MSYIDHESHTYIARGCYYTGDIFLYRFPCPQQAFDGISLFFAARRSVYLKEPAQYTTIINEQFKRTELELDQRDTWIMHNSKQRRVRRLFGIANYQGEAGLSGNFEGWFTADDKALPLKSKLKITLGSITVHLKEIRRIEVENNNLTPAEEQHE